MYDEDYGPIPHSIKCNSRWPTCNGGHATVAEVKDCWRKQRVVENEARHGDGDYFCCTWLVLRHYDDGSPYSVDCGALARVTKSGFECEAGHSHVNAETRAAEGWEYAEDGNEARQLAMAGVEPRDMQGRAWA